MHEDNAHYDNCKKRERNKGLFTADQASLVYLHGLPACSLPSFQSHKRKTARRLVRSPIQDSLFIKAP